MLGNAQDAGVPQAGCFCERCKKARKNPALWRYAACLGLVDHASGSYWLVDATPDLRVQLAVLQDRHPDYVHAGVLLTHAHAGHYPGLIQYGKEGWNTSGLPLYLSYEMHAYLSDGLPWADLLANNFNLRLFEAERELVLSENLIAKPVRVPHRREYSDTHAFLFKTRDKSLFYCPDIDSWQEIDLAGVLEDADYALLDGTFFSTEELPGRDLSEIPHPFVRETLAAVRDLSKDVWLIHMNHSNPLHDEGPERAYVESKGVQVGEQGQVWVLV